MEFQNFLYRRFCRWITCSLEFWTGASVSIGRKFALVRSNLGLRKQMRTISVDLHIGPSSQRQELFDGLQSVGLMPVGEPLPAHGFELIIFHRQSDIA